MLYFGQAAFWSAFRAAGDDPRGDLLGAGPQLVGRFDLASETLLPPLDVTAPGARSGVWDVHAHRNGRVYFTTFYESMGAVDPASGDVTRFPELGLGLNEIAALPDGNLLVTRYGGAEGALVVVSAAGEALAEYPIEAPEGFRSAPKTPAWDASRREYWVTNDVVPTTAGAQVHTDASVLGPGGELRRRIVEPEVQFVASTPGAGLLRIESADTGLWLVAQDTPQLLDVDFDPDFDFAQDVKFAAGGSSVTTRWSGWVHVAAPDGALRSLRLPSLSPGGLYYTAVLHDDRICATHCGGVDVVCTDAP